MPALACTKFPGSTSRAPVRPPIGARIMVKPRLSCAVSIAAWSACTRALQLRHGRLLVLEALPGLEAAADQLAVAVQVALRAQQLRLVLGCVGLGLVERGLDTAAGRSGTAGHSAAPPALA